VASAAEQLIAAKAELNARCNTVEEAYEFMLAYAGQGLASEAGSAKGGQVREFLRKAEAALGSLSTFIEGFGKGSDSDELQPYVAFMAVIDRDARAARAAIALVLAQSSISSQVIDNLNASIHLRALLTDLFLVDEILKGHGA
jgi:hypothetical protein